MTLLQIVTRAPTDCQKQKSRIEMQLLLRISRFCNPQRKHRKPSTYVQSPGGRVVNVDKGFISVLVVKSFYNYNIY